MIKNFQRGIGVVELVIVLFLLATISAIAIPKLTATLRNYRALGSARDVTAEVFLAKMRASSAFTETRVYFDVSAGTFRIDLWNKTTKTWGIDSPSGPTALSQGISFPTTFGTVTTDPTGATLAQAPACRPGDTTTGVPGAGSDIANTVCIVFNSRGIPIDNTGAATQADAIYITDGTTYYGTTIAASGHMRSWSRPTGLGAWVQR